MALVEPWDGEVQCVYRGPHTHPVLHRIDKPSEGPPSIVLGGRGAQAGQQARLDLSNSLAGYTKLARYLLQGELVACEIRPSRRTRSRGSVSPDRCQEPLSSQFPVDRKGRRYDRVHAAATSGGIGSPATGRRSPTVCASDTVAAQTATFRMPISAPPVLPKDRLFIVQVLRLGVVRHRSVNDERRVRADAGEKREDAGLLGRPNPGPPENVAPPDRKKVAHLAGTGADVRANTKLSSCPCRYGSSSSPRRSRSFNKRSGGRSSPNVSPILRAAIATEPSRCADECCPASRSAVSVSRRSDPV